MHFLGTNLLKVDEKGRFSVPTRWSDGIGLQPQWMLTAGPRGCLLLLDRETWLSQAARIQEDVFCSRQERQLRFLFVGHAQEVSVDKSGRVVISDALRRYAEIEFTEGVFLVGTGTSIEIWASAKWKQETDSAKEADQLFDLPTDPGPDGTRELEPVST